MDSPSGSAEEGGGAGSPAAEWQQGDYSLSMRSFPVVDDLEDGELALGGDAVVGVAVVTQTCDIVNTTPGKEHVVVCPLVEISQASLDGIRKGRTLAAAALEHPPAPNVVVDIGRMASLHKSALAKLERRDGFSTDAARIQFAEALERKFGRFAFPDQFNDGVLSKLRDRILGAHGKAASEHGEAYRSIRTARVAAVPGWGARGEKRIVFHFVLESGARREATRGPIKPRQHDDRVPFRPRRRQGAQWLDVPARPARQGDMDG